MPTDIESEQNCRMSIVLLRENVMPIESNEQNFSDSTPQTGPRPNDFVASEPDTNPARRTAAEDRETCG
ncbi:MAG: hypothetical protein CMM26_01160 [Rhodospirillaceae bacterium]|nr:hypothetical protein [Rhodospirillaceae bacterium]